MASVTRRVVGSLAEVLPQTIGGVEHRFWRNRATFWEVLHTSAKHGDVRRVQAWLSRAAEANFRIGTKASSLQITALARVADVKEAEKVLLDLMRSRMHPDTGAFNMVLSACARAENLDSALKWFRRMTQANLAADAVTHNTVIATCTRVGNLPLAEEWANNMVDQSIALNAVCCGSIVLGYARQGDGYGAQKWLRRMLEWGLRPGSRAFNAVVSVSEPAVAEAFLWKALEAGAQPSEAALQRTLKAFVEVQDWEACERFKGLLRHLGHWPSAWAVALLSKPHAAAGDFTTVEELMAELRTQIPSQAADKLDDRVGSEDALDLDVDCLKALLAAYARAAQPFADQRVEVCVERLLSRGVRDAATLGDARRALGKEKYDCLAHTFGLTVRPDISRKRHSRSRIVGTWGEISPC